MMRCKVLAYALVLAGIVTLSGFSLAYAYGVQNHTVNGVTHGCPFDPGCTSGGKAGDYNRHGYTRWNSGPSLINPWVSVHNSAGTQLTYGHCSSCVRVDAQYDTNPVPECRYKTLHVVDNGARLNSHWHYTAYALNSTPTC